jgi:glycosyltransferase involved in cell wall biosynthesis
MFYMTKSRHICFLANDQRFFFRHFRPAILAAASLGYKLTAYLPDDEQGEAGSLQAGVEIIRSPIARQPLTVPGLCRQTVWLVRQLRKQQPDIVLAFSVRPALVLALALPWVKLERAIMYVTGLGLLDLLSDRKSRFQRRLTYWVLRRTSRRPSCYFIFENRADPLSMGFRQGEPERHKLLVGAGVDDGEFFPSSMPGLGILKLASVSRLVWSKGIDLASAAVAELAKAGHPVELSIYGAPDASNPRAINPADWSADPGVFFRGHTDDIPGIWREHHIGIFPSRGGEGVPRSLIEAAACGRPSIVTDVPGCRDFVRSGVDGYVVACESIPALKKAILDVLNRSESLTVMGEAARKQFLRTSTSRIIQKQYEGLFELPSEA